MTPGPIAGRPGPGADTSLRPPSDHAPGTAPEGTSFADLLSAMLSPGPPPARINAEGEEKVFERLDAAQMFNETGLFNGAAPLTTGPAMEVEAGRPGPQPESHGPAASPSESIAPADPAKQPESRAAPLAFTRGASDGKIGFFQGILAKAQAYRPSAMQPKSTTPAGAAARSVEAAAARMAGREGIERAAARIVRAHLREGGSTAAQVIVQAADGGLNLAVRADRLSREQREKLRAEIGEILARHGFTATHIMLNGEAARLPRGRNE